MSKFLLYTFKNFPFKDSISRYSPFEFHRFKADFEVFSEKIFRTKPKLIIGVAKSPDNKSHFETKTINVFNKDKKIDKSGRIDYLLDYPLNGYKSLAVNQNATDSFCNWTMYKISQIIENQNVKLQFIHTTKSDIHFLEEYLSSLE